MRLVINASTCVLFMAAMAGGYIAWGVDNRLRPIDIIDDPLINTVHAPPPSMD